MPHARDHDETTALPSGGAVPAPEQTPESVVVRVRRHGRHLTLPVLLLLAVAAAGGYFIGWFPEQWMNLAAAGGAAAIAILFGLGPILGWLAHRTVITTRRVVVHRGFFVRHRSEISLARVREVRTKQNPVQRMWRSGDIDLFVGTEATRILDVPQVAEIHTLLRELSERSYDDQLRNSGFAADFGGPSL